MILGRLFRRPAPSTPASADRPPDETLIFAYTLGGETRYADPLKIDRLLQLHGGDDWGKSIDVVAALHKPLGSFVADTLTPAELADRRQRFNAAVETLVTLVRAVFAFPAVDPATGAGVSEAECLAVLNEYLKFSDRAAEDARPFSPPR